MELDKDLRSRQQVRQLCLRAKSAQQTLQSFSLEQINRICEAIAEAGVQHAEELSRLACEETGFGKPEDKVIKNRFASEGVMNAIRDMKTVGILSEDSTNKTIDIAVPVGVIAGIVPSTNPTSTIFYKSLISIKGGNTIVFSPHPNALHCTKRASEIAMAAARDAGCPDGAIGCISEPTMDAVDELMHHTDVRLILATGGGAMVRAAYSSGKPAIGVGAGNGPAYIHPSADVKKAIGMIIRSKTFDNGTICASEQSIVTVKAMESAVVRELKEQNAYLLTPEEAKKLSGFILRPNGTMNPAIVGRTAHYIAQMAGLLNVPQDTSILVARETTVGEKSPYSHEKLCPILALFIEENENTALNRCCEILHFEGSGHTFVIHAEDRAAVEKFALRVPVSRVLVNTAGALGGVGVTTGLFPALTLGCGAVGGSSSSNNIGPMDLINIRRVAWGIRDNMACTGHTKSAAAQSCDFSSDMIRLLAEQILQKLS